MKTNFTLFLFLFSTSFLFAQHPPNLFFDDLSTVSCPWNDTTTILKPDFWTIYQTQNDRWDGLVDSTRCITVYEEGNDINIDLDQLDLAKPVFVRNTLDAGNPIVLNSDNLYNVSFNFETDDGVVVQLGNDCENDLCTGIIVGIEIPDSAGTGTTERIYQASAREPFNNRYNPSFCYATERFEAPILKTYVLKVTLDSMNTSGSWLQLKNTFNESFDESLTKSVSAIDIPDVFYQDTSYVYSLDNLADLLEAVNFLMLYSETTYPSPQNPGFVELKPVPNVATSEWIDLIVEEYQTIVFQPHTFLRGGLIEGSDSIRHQFNLINRGGDICMYPFIEFAFSGSNSFVHQGGNIDFHGTTSCMMFRNGGKFEVGKSTFLEYGDGGEGILALGKDAKVRLETGSTLSIDNKVILLDRVEGFEEQVKVDLQPGSALIFEDQASLIRAAGASGNQVLNVYMNGGLLDDHKLSEEERLLINRIFPEQKEIFYPKENILIYPNPVKEMLTCRFNSSIDQTVDLEIINANGQLVYQKSYAAFEGINEVSLNTRLKTKGVFVLRLNSSDGLRSEVFIK